MLPFSLELTGIMVQAGAEFAGIMVPDFAELTGIDESCLSPGSGLCNHFTFDL
jgi:hypothetical protein